MTTFGQIQEFRPETESISSYLERVQLFFEANDVAAEKQVPVFLSVVGGKTYTLLRNLLSPVSPKDKSFDQLAEVLKNHYEPRPLVIAERFHFHRRNQAVEESVVEYVAELRRLATHCRFGAYLDEALRDRIVCGLCNESAQKRLLSEKDLTLARALEIAQGMEAADRNAQDLKKGEIAVRQVKPAKQTMIGTELCYRCGRGNTPQECRFKDAICHKCNKKGHLARVCRSKGQPSERQRAGGRARTSKGKTKWVECSPEPQSEVVRGQLESAIYSVGNTLTRPIVVDMEINGKTVPMEVDTGAAVSIMSQQTKELLFPDMALEKSSVVLRTYTAEPMLVTGQMRVQVQYHGYSGTQVVYVVEGSGPTLLGRDWLTSIRLDWHTISTMACDGSSSPIEKVLRKHSGVFQEGLGTMKSFKAKLLLKEDAKPRFHRPRKVPFALREPIEQELDRLEKAGIIEGVSHSEWAAPIVPVPKPDGTIRLCGDYKVTINPQLEIDQYPLPRPEDLMNSLLGGQRFTKLDLTAAYQQMLLEEGSRKLVTINTHKGLFQYTRLPFGVAPAPAVFQKAMDSILQGIPHVICYIDDIVVTGRTEAEHLKNLDTVLTRLEEHGVRLKRKKCSFFQSSVEYLGHCIEEAGVRTSEKKVEAIQQAPRPKNVRELRSFLGLLNYYCKFIPNLASLLQPLNSLLRAGQRWKWTAECERVFVLAKEKLTTAPVLVHYNPQLPLKLAGDASAYGVGAVISHIFPDGSERPIAFASRTLSQSERNYAQVEKEALSIIFGTQKFHQYLYGRKFTIVTDHKPLMTILGPKNGIPSLAAARLQRWAIQLSAHQYDIEFKPTLAHGNDDGLSRLPLDETDVRHRGTQCI